MPIPLLRFPLLVLDEIVKTMELQQLFTLSLCSKRMHLVVKNLRNKSVELKLSLITKNLENRFSMSVKNIFHSRLDVNVLSIRENQRGGWRVDEFPEAVFNGNRYNLDSYWEDAENGTRCIMKHFCDLFGVTVEKVFVDQNLWVLGLVEELQGPKSYDAYCGRTGLTDEQFRHLLVDLNPTRLHLYDRPSEQFRIEHFHKVYDTLDVGIGHWISGENLLTLDCARLYIQFKTFTAAEINRFLGHVLVEGRAPRLMHFYAEVETTDANAILDGIKEVFTAIPGKEQFEENENLWKFSGLIERGNRSVMATVNCNKKKWSISLNIE